MVNNNNIVSNCMGGRRWKGMGGFGVIYHTVKVGNNQEVIFRSDEDRECTTLLKRYKSGFVFVSMPMFSCPTMSISYWNRAVVLPGSCSLTVPMPGISTKYTGAVGTYSRPLFVLPVPNGTFRKLLRWIHFHPARGCTDNRGFPWSSHGEYLSTGPEAMIDREVILLTLARILPAGSCREVLAGWKKNSLWQWRLGRGGGCGGAAGQGMVGKQPQYLNWLPKLLNRNPGQDLQQR